MNLFSILLGSMMLLTPTPAVADEPPPIVVYTAPIQAKTPPPVVLNPKDDPSYLISKYDWDTDIAEAIMNCESGGNPEALNDNPSTGDYSVGLMQINVYGANASSRPSEQELKDPETNISFAYELYKNGGFNHWKNCYDKTGTRNP